MFKFMLEELLKGNLSALNFEIIVKRALAMLYAEFHTKDDINDMKDIIVISNILYNNTDLEMLPLEDGVYDLLLELYRKYNPNVPVGAPVVKFENTNQITTVAKKPKCPISYLDNERDDFLFFDELISKQGMFINRRGLRKPISYTNEEKNNVSKINVASEQKYPELVGTLGKCKFVLNAQAEAKGVLNDPKVKVFERDFIHKHIDAGIYNWDTIIRAIFEIKYDGISVVTDTTNKIENAGSRGDTDEALAADLTPIVKNYVFPNVFGKIPDDIDPFGIKWEAILTYNALKEYSRLRDKNYKNPRNTISGIFNASDGADFVNLITLVPIASSLGLDRVTDIEFLNKYYSKEEKLRYCIVEGTPAEILFYLKRFVEEAELMRSIMPFMYDGVVFSYLDEDIIDKLGRKNSTNQYSVAIKFNPQKKQTTVRGVSFTVGQNGMITPMLHYDPVEFFGNVQTKCTLHSRDRFMALQIRYGDIVDLDYNADVMTYATKPDNSQNANNPNPMYEFPTVCVCGTPIRISDTGKSAYCDNINCEGRIISKAVNMLDKLNLKDFAEANIREIGKYTFGEMLLSKPEDLVSLGEVTAQKFLDRMNELKTTPIEDFKMIGSLGFSSIAKDTWKKIFQVYSIQDILFMHEEQSLYNALINIRDIGKSKATTIVEELPYFLNDIEIIQTQIPIITTKGASSTGKVIRCSGFRDASLIKKLEDMGQDADDNAGVTKKTDILLVPDLAYTSPKVDKALEYGIKIIPKSEFLDNMDSYLF